MRYYKGMTQDDVADVLGVNQRWVSRHENTALSKLSSKVV
jgi:DNA-directed RNA polymerase specialized sigma subunit